MNKRIFSLGLVIVLSVTLLCGCKIKDYDKALIDINNGEDFVTLGYANFVFKYNEAMYDIQYGSSYGTRLWSQDLTGSGQTFLDEVKGNVVNTIEEQYAYKKHAFELGVELTEADNNKIDEAVDKFFSDNTSSAINKLGADRDVVREFFVNLTYVALVQQELTKRGTESGEINEENTDTSYINSILNGWKDGIVFTVDEDLLSRLETGDMFVSNKTKE